MLLSSIPQAQCHAISAYVIGAIPPGASSLLRQATGAITLGYRCRSLIRLLSTIYGCSIYSCCSALCSVFILWLLMDMSAFCVFKQFSAQVGLFRLCACLSISILCSCVTLQPHIIRNNPIFKRLDIFSWCVLVLRFVK